MIDNGSKNVQPIPLGVTFSNAVSSSKLKVRTSLFHWNVAKEMFELWALSFRKWHPKWDWLYFYQFRGMYFVNSKIYCVLKCLCVVKLWRKRWMLDDVCKSVVFSVDIIEWLHAHAFSRTHCVQVFELTDSSHGGTVRSTLHPAWVVLANVHAGFACMRGLFQALVDRLTKSGLRQLEAGANRPQSVICTRRV